MASPVGAGPEKGQRNLGDGTPLVGAPGFASTPAQPVEPAAPSGPRRRLVGALWERPGRRSTKGVAAGRCAGREAGTPAEPVPGGHWGGTADRASRILVSKPQ